MFYLILSIAFSAPYPRFVLIYDGDVIVLPYVQPSASYLQRNPHFLLSLSFFIVYSIVTFFVVVAGTLLLYYPLIPPTSLSKLEWIKEGSKYVVG